jgi:hypothetical protein
MKTVLIAEDNPVNREHTTGVARNARLRRN